MNIKSFIKNFGQGVWAGLIILAVACIGLFAFNGPDVAPENAVQLTGENETVETKFYAGAAQQKIYALDTLTTAGTYTTVIPYNLSSPYQYQYFLKMRKIGVTPNIKVVLDERNCSNSAVWSAIDSFSMVGVDSTKLNFRLRGSITYGAAHRLRFVKTGNGAVARNIEINIKPTN